MHVKYIVRHGVDLSHLFESNTCSSLKCALGLSELAYVDGEAFELFMYSEGSSRSEKLWNSKMQDKLDKIRKSNVYRNKHGHDLLKESQCRYSLFNNEGKVTRRHRLYGEPNR